jgi:hypothetical protein
MKQSRSEIRQLQKMAGILGAKIKPGVINENKQIDISDEEIRDAAIQYEDTTNKEESPMAHFIEGAMWYRERLNKI